MSDVHEDCIVCWHYERDDRGLSLVPDPKLEKIRDILVKAKERCNYGEGQFKALYEYMESLESLENLRYHNHCRKKVVHKGHIDRAKRKSLESSSSVTIKQGRPSKTDSSATRISRTLTSHAFKERKCIFAPCKWNQDPIYKVVSDERGQLLLDIKQKTTNDKIRTSLALLTEKGTARCNEKFYHQNCLRDAEQTCKDLNNKSGDNYLEKIMIEKLADVELLSFVRSDLTLGEMLTMKDLNKDYTYLLEEHGLANVSDNYKKHIKTLISDNIENVSFVRPPQRNESERVVSTMIVEDAFEDYIHWESELMRISKLLRRELLENHRKWTFSGSLTTHTFDTPMLKVFFRQLIFGPQGTSRGGKRDNEVDKTVDIMIQLLLGNVKTDRQAKYKPKTSKGYKRMVHTPFSLGLSMLIHSKTRSKMLIDDLADMTLGETYKITVNAEKLIKSAVIERMKGSGGYCLPGFVKKGVQPYFAIDNVDKNTDTAYGQNTFHGTIIVINQEKNDSAEPLFSELKIPEKIENSRIEVLYCEEPVIKPICPKYGEYFQHIDNILDDYISRDAAWALANYYSNVIRPNEPENDSVDESMEVCDDERIESISLSNILNITSKKRSKTTNTKSKVMPTWAATNSLLLSNLKLEKTDSEVVAPILCRPPTDYASLYTALKLTQDISAVVVGPSRKTIITLDMDLFQRALKIKFSVSKENWVLRPGELHICFAALHALGKYIDGSGLGSPAIESNIYSPATLRQVYGGKAFKRGVEHHVINLLSIYYLQFDAVIADDSTDDLRIKCIRLRDRLHQRDECVNDIFKEIKEYCCNKIGCASQDKSVTGLAKFLMNYIQQVETLLCIIRACRQSDFTEFFSALDNQCKYFFAHDLYNYARLIPVHLAMMNDIKRKDPETWQLLSNETFGVNKPSVPFTTLFVDQNLEQKIKDIKGVGGISGITQQEDTLNRFFLTAPYITRMVNGFLGKYCNDRNTERTEHYQLHGNISFRISKNAAALKQSLEIHCEGNPFATPMPMKNVLSSMLIPDSVLSDILDRDEKGETGYKDFVVTRLLESIVAIWAKMTKLKLKTCSTWVSKTAIKHGDKVIKLREEPQLFAQFLIIHQARPQLLPNLPQTIGEYEMAITPQSLFTSDGNLLVPKDKSAFVHAVENLVCTIEIVGQPVPSEMEIETNEAELDTSDLLEIEVDEGKKVIIFDGMAIVQSMKKSPSMKKMINFAEQFEKRVKRLMKGYSEGRVLFDQYLENSLKTNTRKGRGDVDSKASYQIHSDMNIAAIPLKELFASSKTKSQLTEYLSLHLIKAFSSGDQKLVVTYGNKVLTTQPNLTGFLEHSHEEADTQIPLHVLDAIHRESIKVVDVWSPDTDILLLLIDLAASTTDGEICNLNLLTGKGDKYRSIDILEKVKALGREKSRAIIGLHNFSGADWGGKFAGIGKQTWIKSFLALDEKDPIKALHLLGEVNFTGNPTSIPSAYLPLEKFLCTVYNPNTKIHTVKGLRWELFRNSNMEGERLPPTVGSFIPHLKRVSYTSMRDKSYCSVMPSLPPIEEAGWDIVDGSYHPVKSLLPPAPSAVLELVKCGCKGRCDPEKKQCSCVKNGLSCTPLCKCVDCLNSVDYKLTEEEVDDEENA